jgi:uncharacterized membrane-anchored protein
VVISLEESNLDEGEETATLPGVRTSEHRLGAGRLAATSRTRAVTSSLVASKVPQVTVLFWVIKILTTGMGETTSDYFIRRFDPVAVVVIAGGVLAATLAIQLLASRYVAWIYWSAVVMVSVFGTMAADVVHVVLGVPYLASTIFFSAALAVVFATWYASERTLSIHSIRTRRREMFYWAAVLATFALGTATGDMTAVTMHLGYLSSGIMFAFLIALPALAHWLWKLDAILAFWWAYVLTRPLGASFADWAGVSHGRGGLDLGTGPVSLVLAVFIVLLVGYLTFVHGDSEPETVPPTVID